MSVHDTVSNVWGTLKHVLDYIAAGITVGALMQWVPLVVAAMNGIYVAFRLYELIERRIKYGGLKQDQS